MGGFILRRIFLAILVAIAVSLISFLMLRLSGDLAMVLAGDGASEAEIAAVAKANGLDKHILLQYFDWLWKLLKGDLGTSLFTHQPTLDMILLAAPITGLLSLYSLLMALALAIPLGVIAASKPNSLLDRIVLALAVGGKAMPSFWLALILMYWLGVQWRWLPISGLTSWKHYIMPVITMAVSVLPQLMRLTRSGMIDTLDSDYIRMAQAKGLPRTSILFKHALKNAILPVVAMSAISLGFLLSGAVIVETIFSINGIGALAYRSIVRIDFPVVQAILFFLSFVYILLTLAADLINAWIDPRIKVQ